MHSNLLHIFVLVVVTLPLQGVDSFTPTSSTRLNPLLSQQHNKNGFGTKNERSSSKHHGSIQLQMVKEIMESVVLEKEKELTVNESTTIQPSSLNDNSKDNGDDNDDASTSFSYGEFAKQYPFVNNIGIATTKTAAADLLAQTVIGHTPLLEVDLERSLLFMTFGAIYLGGFQYLYQVQVFKKLFDIEKFTNLSWKEKLEDTEGLKALAAQTALDLTVLTVIYLPTFYIFKAGLFSGSPDPSVWTSTGLDNYITNFAKDEADLLKVWFPADLVCFSVPLYLRLPVRHVVSFAWTIYLSFARGGH